MKRLLVLALLAAVGCASVKDGDAGYDTGASRVEGDPNPYSDYTLAMKNDPACPMAVPWQAENGKAIETATQVEAMKALVAKPAAVDALLAQVKGAYATDPLVATQIGAISQLMMCRKWAGAPAARDVWTEALLRAAEGTSDAYRKMFFLDQLRWCGKPAQADRIRAIGKTAGDGHVAEFADWVANDVK